MNVSQIIYLHIGSMDIAYVETLDGKWLDKEEDIQEFCRDLNAWDVKEGLGLAFDGYLDYPENFLSFKAISISRSSKVTCNSKGLKVSNVTFYLEVVSEDGLLEEELEDLIHIAIPTVEVGGVKIAFTDLSDWEIGVEDEVPYGCTKLGVIDA